MKSSFSVNFSWPTNAQSYWNPISAELIERDGEPFVRLNSTASTNIYVPAGSFSDFVDALSEFAEHNGLYDKRWAQAFPAEVPAPEDTRSA